MKSLSTVSATGLQKLYSTEYDGEWINVSLGQNKIDRRFIKPELIFKNPSGNAICLGNGKTRLDYSLEKLENTNKRKILRYYNVTYGCNAIYRDWQPDFLISTNQLLTAKMPNELHGITFSPQEIMRRYKGMNLIPGNFRADAGSLAAYLAAFHGAKRIFLFGYDGQQKANENPNVYANTEFYPSDKELIDDVQWMNNLKKVIETYNDIEFFRVASRVEDSYRPLLKLSNYNVINLRKFVSLADL